MWIDSNPDSECPHTTQYTEVSEIIQIEVDRSKYGYDIRFLPQNTQFLMRTCLELLLKVMLFLFTE